MTKQVPSKHDTTRTVISILPLATFHQWLIKLVDCSTLCANLTPVSLFLCFLTPVQTVTETDIVLKQWCVFWVCVCVRACVCVWANDWVDILMYLLRKKPKHFVWYFYSSALPVQLNMYNVTVSLLFCWRMAWWWSWIARAGLLQLLKVRCWRDWSRFLCVCVCVLFIIDCTKKCVFVEMHDIGCKIQRSTHNGPLMEKLYFITMQ